MTCNHGKFHSYKIYNILYDSVKLFLLDTCSHKIVLKKDWQESIIS